MHVTIPLLLGILFLLCQGVIAQIEMMCNIAVTVIIAKLFDGEKCGLVDFFFSFADVKLYFFLTLFVSVALTLVNKTFTFLCEA